MPVKASVYTPKRKHCFLEIRKAADSVAVNGIPATGVRRGIVCGLCWLVIDWYQRVLHIQWSAVKLSGAPIPAQDTVKGAYLLKALCKLLQVWEK